MLLVRGVRTVEIKGAEKHVMLLGSANRYYQQLFVNRRNWQLCLIAVL